MVGNCCSDWRSWVRLVPEQPKSGSLSDPMNQRDFASSPGWATAPLMLLRQANAWNEGPVATARDAEIKPRREPLPRSVFSLLRAVGRFVSVGGMRAPAAITDQGGKGGK
jgi:hypothetical protein